MHHRAFFVEVDESANVSRRRIAYRHEQTVRPVVACEVAGVYRFLPCFPATITGKMAPFTAICAAYLSIRRALTGDEKKRWLVVVASLNEVRRFVALLLAAFTGPMAFLAAVLALVLLGGFSRWVAGVAAGTTPEPVPTTSRTETARGLLAVAATGVRSLWQETMFVAGLPFVLGEQQLAGGACWRRRALLLSRTSADFSLPTNSS